jgi:hypothetical protein
MKTMLKLAVLMGALLLLTGVVFAKPPSDCYCYEAVWTDLDDNISTPYCCEYICLDEANNTGQWGGMDLFLFFDSMNKQVLGYAVNSDICTAYLKYHGDDYSVISGIHNCSGSHRFAFRGVKTGLDECK